MKMVKRVSAGDGQVNGAHDDSDEYLGTGENHAMGFDMQDVRDLNVPDVSFGAQQVKGQNGMHPNSGSRYSF